MRKIKKIMFVAFSILLTACTDTMQTGDTLRDFDDVSENDTSISTEYETEDQRLNTSDYVLNMQYTPIYDNVSFIEESATGAPISYEELQEYMGAYEDISFVEYEILYQYTPEEAFQKTGSDIFINSTTLYKAHIFYDYLNDTDVDLIVDISKAGMPDKQIKGNPPYVIGQKIISALSGFSRTRCVAIPELTFLVYDVNGIDLAYHVDCSDITIDDDSFANLDMQLANEEVSFITTTKNNPVVFNQKSTINDLTQFIKQDWTERGYEFTNIIEESEAYYRRNEEDDVKVVE